MSLGQQIVNQLLRDLKESKERKTQIYREKVRVVLELVIDEGGMTQEEIAEELGIGQPTVSKYLTGTLSPPKETVEELIALAKRCEVKLPSNGWANQ